MTLPINIDYPFNPEKILGNDEDFISYMRDLTKTLTDTYERSVPNIDGNLEDYTATVSGETTEGVGTYTNQKGLVLRQGIRTTVYFNISWTAHTGTGFLNVDLPYKIAKIGSDIFTGSVELWAIGFPVGYTYSLLHGIDDSYKARVQMCGSGVGSVSLSMPASGMIIGSINYIGQENE